MSTVSDFPRRRKRDAPKRALRALRHELQAARRRTRVASAVAVLASLIAVGFAVQPTPEPVPVALGQGTAGVRSQTALPVAPADSAVATELRADVDAAPAQTDSAIGEGEASYYGDELAGQPTASGDPFEPTRLTAAHRTLPLGTKLRVTNLHTDESVVVVVNDRGPYARHRVLDLSRRAARRIGMLRSGTAPVRLEIVRG